MDSRVMADNIVTTLRGDEERLTAWGSVLLQRLGSEKLAILRNEVENQIANTRSGSSYLESVAEFQRQLDDAKDDTVRLQLLHALTQRPSNVG